MVDLNRRSPQPARRSRAPVHDAAAGCRNLGALCRVASESALGPRVMECIRDATQRCHVGRDSGREDDKSLMFIDCGWSAGVCVELIKLRVVQSAAFGWRPGSVRCHGDHTPVGGLLSTESGKASAGLPNTAMAMPAAPGLETDRGVDVLFLRHSSSLSNRDSRVGITTRKLRANRLSFAQSCWYGPLPAAQAEGYEAMYAKCAYPSVQDVTENAILDAGAQLKLLRFRGSLILLRGGERAGRGGLAFDVARSDSRPVSACPARSDAVDLPLRQKTCHTATACSPSARGVVAAMPTARRAAGRPVVAGRCGLPPPTRATWAPRSASSPCCTPGARSGSNGKSGGAASREISRACQ